MILLLIEDSVILRLCLYFTLTPLFLKLGRLGTQVRHLLLLGNFATASLRSWHCLQPYNDITSPDNTVYK